MARRQYSEEQRAAVMAALLAGQSISEAAGQYGVPIGTVKGWSRGTDRPRVQLDASTKNEIGELLLAYVRKALTTLTAQLEVFADGVWLRKQGASDLAVLHGVGTDKVIRLLEAMGTPDDESAKPHESP